MTLPENACGSLQAHSPCSLCLLIAYPVGSMTTIGMCTIPGLVSGMYWIISVCGRKGKKEGGEKQRERGSKEGGRD